MHEPSSAQRRLHEEIRRKLVFLMQRDISDPRLFGIGVTRIEPSPGNELLRIFVHRLNEEEPAQCVERLNRLAAHFSHEVTRSMQKKRLPRLRFFWDDAFDKSSRVIDLLSRLERER